MSELTRNQLVTRRNFFQRAAGAAAATGIGAGLASQNPSEAASADAPRRWAYDDSAYRRTDPKLIHFHETGRFQCSRPFARCMALTKDNRIFIGAGKYVLEQTIDGTRVSEFAVAKEVQCLALSEDGLLYVGLRDHVEVYDLKGQQQGQWPSPGPKAYFTGLAVGASDLFVADAGNRLVLRYDRSGTLKNRIGDKSKEPKPPGFIVPSPFFDVKIAPDGLLRVGNPGRHQVEAYTFDGDFEFAWGKPGAGIHHFCGCCNPIRLALQSDGRVVTFEKGIPRVKVYSVEGEFESVVAGAESFVENAKVCGPNDCTLGGLDGAVDSQGRIWILDLVAGNVRKLERNRG